ncbi:lipopolysaccharide biosynthesis protein [Aestuariispira ectoiniformans]|uniref:lipopolysaccharide biosynthesis protein n=1 Tax=Aestuariispira ectoiniformans TaxID=2775080 RepID=UPI00223B3415|nr:lipopolysaccharide biosynthesis protein [Aestuariispira ectoiniformans]
MSIDGGESPALASKVAKGAAVMGFTRLLARTMGLVSTVILARLLMPEDFGLVAIALSYIHFFIGISDLNFQKALITESDPTDADFSTAWTLNVLRGVALSLITLASSSFLPAMLDEPRLGPVIAVLSVFPLLEGSANAKFITFEKNLDFSREMILAVGTKFLSVVLTVVLAFLLKNYWVLVIGTLFGAFAKVTLSFALMPFRPSFTFASHRKLIQFSGWLMGATLLRSVGQQMDKLIVAALLGTKTTGIYHVGQQLAQIPTTEMIAPLNRALHPAFSSVRKSGGDMKSKALESAEILGALALPVGVGFAMVAHELIAIIYGEKWLEATIVLQILVPALAIERVATVADSIALALGHTKRIFTRQTIVTLFALSMQVLGGYLWGLIGILAAFAAARIVALFLNLMMLQHMLGTPSYLYILRIRRSVLAVTGMALLIYFAEQNGWFTDMHLYLVAFLKVVMGAAAYTGIHMAAWYAEGRPNGFETRVLNVVKKRLFGGARDVKAGL